MPVYDYKALTEKGSETRGVIDADSAKEAREKLRQKRMHVTEMTEARSRQGRQKSTARLKFEFPKLRRAPGASDVPMVTRQLATLLRAGIPLTEAVTVLIDQIENRNLERTFRQIKEDIASGVTTTDAFARHPQYFNALYINMVKAGEASGSLDEILKRLADFLQKQSKTKGKVTAALVYPIAMCVIGVLVVIFLMKFVVPKVVGTILDRGIEPPLPTEILMTVSGFVASYWWALILGGVLGLALYQAWVSTPKGRLVRDTYLLKLPIFGILFKKQSVSRFTTTFAILLKSGVPALEALRILREIVDNALMSKTLVDVHDRILEGADIATPLRKSGVFPPVIGYMIAVGEQSGQLEEILEKISEAYDEEIDVTVQKVTALIEPVVIIIMAVVVGFIVLAVVLPLVEGFSNIG
jgi:general secretion pathway protein F